MSIKEQITTQTKAINKLATDALQKAEELGAFETKISTSVSSAKKLVIENKQFSLANTIDSQRMNIITHKGKKKGSSSINVANEESVTQAIKHALSLASFSVADENLILASLDQAPKSKSLDFLLEEDLAETPLEEIQDMMETILERLLKDKRIALDRLEMGVSLSTHGLFNSHGVSQSEIQATAGWEFMGMAVDGAEVTSFDYDGNFSFSKGTILEKALAGADEFVEKVIGNLKPKKCPSYKGAVLLSPRAVSSLLTNVLLFHASGRAVMDDKSKWDKAVGTGVMSDKFTLTDDPHNPLFIGATSHDRDGVPTIKQTIIENGVLTKHLHDCYSANKTKSKTTATAGGPFSTTIATGDASFEEMTKASKDILVVDRFAGNTDPLTGDFSGVVKCSHLYTDGQDTGSVTETMIAGNFFEIAKNILSVGNKSISVHGSFASPYILVDGVSVTGEN